MHTDSWALKAKKLGFRSRAAFKLEEILIKTKALKNNSLVLDVGSAPGGWSQLIKTIKPKSIVYAVDLLPMDPIKDVYFFQENIANIDSIKEISLLSIYFIHTFKNTGCATHVEVDLKMERDALRG